MSTSRSLSHVLLLASVGAGACADGPRASRTPPDRVVMQASAETVSAALLLAQRSDTAARRATPKQRVLTDAEQRVADGIAFAPIPTERFVAAARNKRLLVDVGRVDLEIKKDAELLALVRRVSERVGPLARVTHLRVRGTWGEETDSIVGYDVWNGRAVAVLKPSAHADSLLRKGLPLIGVATRVRSPADSAPQAVVAPPPAAQPAATQPPAAPAAAVPTGACVRDSMPPALAARVAFVRDSIVRWVTDSVKPPYAVSPKFSVRGDTASGCFGAWRAIVVVSARTPAFDWSEERAVLVAPDGKSATSRLRDLRLRTHESLVAFDADGDGIDELGTRGLGPRMGAQSVLRLDPATRRFARYASGFAWESR
jgi:hypothetical protein